MPELAELVNEHLVSSVKECFSVTLGIDLTESDDLRQPNPENCLICSIGFTGKLEGSVAVIVVDKTACYIVGKMLGMEFLTIDADVKDGFGEMGNMIAGGLKNRLSQTGDACNISVPTTIIGKNLEISFPKDVTTVAKSFKGGDIEFGVIVDFKVHQEVASAVKDAAVLAKEAAMAKLKAMVNNTTKT
jgi:CheY-specific phosphatase CheX